MLFDATKRAGETSGEWLNRMLQDPEYRRYATLKLEEMGSYEDCLNAIACSLHKPHAREFADHGARVYREMREKIIAAWNAYCQMIGDLGYGTRSRMDAEHDRLCAERTARERAEADRDWNEAHPDNHILCHCSRCDSLICEQDEGHEIYGGDIVCEDCFENNYVACYDCGHVVEGDSTTQTHDGNTICYSCASNYRRCGGCERLFREDDLDLCDNDHNAYLCGNCTDDHNVCDECHQIIHSDYSHYVERTGYTYCDNCYRNRGQVHDYSFKPRAKFLPVRDLPYYYGVELEVDGGDDRAGAATALRELDQDEDQFYCKRDGSLNNGIEVVTHPATLEYHEKTFPWEKIRDICREYDYKSHDTTTCGLHVHVSRTAFGESSMEQDLTIAKIMLIFDMLWESRVVPFSRRDITNMHYCEKVNAGIMPSDVAEIAAMKAAKMANGTRYRAINLQNEHTVEFRLFRGTLKRDTIIASIQWLDVLIKYARTTLLKDVLNSSWQEMFANSGHAELDAYLQKKNLIEDGD